MNGAASCVISESFMAFRKRFAGKPTLPRHLDAPVHVVEFGN
jgi:hypothetical protein